jgi:hypothetical protein
MRIAGDEPPHPADLQAVIEAWDTLPETIRDAVGAMVRAGRVMGGGSGGCRSKAAKNERRRGKR